MAVSKQLTCEVEDCSSLINSTDNSNFIMITQNIRSINCNINDFEVLISRLNIELDLIVLTECWLANTVSLPYINGYNSIRSKNLINQNDGLVIYIKDQLEFQHEEPSFQEGNCLILKIYDIVVIATYRSPSFKNIDNFLADLNNTLQNYSSYKNIIVIGDINIDITPSRIDSNSEKYLNLTAFHGLLPAHTLVTRDASGSCIDHVLLKTKNPSMTLVPQTEITDHKPVILNFQMKLCRTPYSTTKSKKINTEKLYSDILSSNFDTVLNNPDPDSALNYFIDTITTAVKNNTQLVTLK